MKRKNKYARTPAGTNLGERVEKNGEWLLKHKSSKQYEFLSPECIAESISGKEVDHIVYKDSDGSI